LFIPRRGALLNGDEFGHQPLNQLNHPDTAGARVIIKMAAPAASEAR
jgi:hypothetical protein